MKLTPEQQRELDAFLSEWERAVLPQVESSAISLTIYTGKFDAKLALEFGAAVLLNKPIIVIACHGARIPTKVLAVVDEIVDIEGDMQSSANFAKVRAGISRVLARSGTSVPDAE